MSNTYNPNTTITNGGYTLGTGGNGSVLTASVTGTTWTHPNAHFNNGNGQPLMTIPHGEDKVIIEDRAELEVKGTVKINGIDLEERLKTIEKILTIPERDPALEAKHPRLKELYDEYIHTLAKYRTWEALKDE